MAIINMSSIMSKVRSYANSPEGKKKCDGYLKKCRKEGKHTTDAGDEIITKDTMCQAAERMIIVLKEAVQEHQLPASVQEHFNSLQYSLPVEIGNTGNLYKIDIWFADDLSRMSLLITKGSRKGQRTGEGIKNIVSLFDTGYTSSASAFGEWSGHEDLGVIRTPTHKSGKQFMSQAVETFNRVWGEAYNVRAMVVADPNFYTRN